MSTGSLSPPSSVIAIGARVPGGVTPQRRDDVAGERGRRVEPLGGVLREELGPGLRPGDARGALISRNSSASVVGDDEQPVTVRSAGVLDAVLDASPPRLDERGAGSPGRARRPARPRVVSRFADSITMTSPDRVSRTSSSYCSSASDSTSTSSAAGVPTRCRHTWNGRYVSSWTV